MMIGGEFNTPGDWLRAGNAIKTVDDFAAANGGNAPVLVFVDTGGAFNNDTECVNGPRGNSADHLTKDVVPFMEANYGVSANRANWGLVGWSMGGTCAVDLATMHPDMFSTFEDIAGDLAPNSGTKQQTIDRLFGGNAAAYAAFDPTTVITKHGPYTGLSGWFDVNGSAPSSGPTVVNAVNANGTGLGGKDAAVHVSDQAAAANSLCALGAANGINCAVVAQPGKHDWPFADHAFAAALPWLAGQVGTPGVPRLGLPGASPAGVAPSVVGFGGDDLGEERVGAGPGQPGPGEVPDPLTTQGRRLRGVGATVGPTVTVVVDQSWSQAWISVSSSPSPFSSGSAAVPLAVEDAGGADGARSQSHRDARGRRAVGQRDPHRGEHRRVGGFDGPVDGVAPPRRTSAAARPASPPTRRRWRSRPGSVRRPVPRPSA